MLPSLSLKLKLVNGKIPKGELSASNRLPIQCCIEMLKGCDTDFRNNHFTVIELVDELELVAEQTILDDHIDRVTGAFYDTFLGTGNSWRRWSCTARLHSNHSYNNTISHSAVY